jgi:hypothetical protein
MNKCTDKERRYEQRINEEKYKEKKKKQKIEG